MLSRVLLQFNDPDLKKIYSREKADFFSKAMPVITLMIGLLTVALVVVYESDEDQELPTYITLVNAVAFVLFLVITCLQSRMTWMHHIICPCLTVLIFLYLTFLDYDYTIGSIYYS